MGFLILPTHKANLTKHFACHDAEANDEKKRVKKNNPKALDAQAKKKKGNLKRFPYGFLVIAVTRVNVVKALPVLPAKTGVEGPSEPLFQVMPQNLLILLPE